MELVALMPFVIGIVAILAGAYIKTAKVRAETAERLRERTSHLDDELDDAERERLALQRRIETLEAIVTGEGFELHREARRAGLLDLDLDEPTDGAPARTRRRTR